VNLSPKARVRLSPFTKKAIVSAFGLSISLATLSVIYGSALADPDGEQPAPTEPPASSSAPASSVPPSSTPQPSSPSTAAQPQPQQQAAQPRAAQDGGCEGGLMVQMKVNGVTRLATFDSELNIGPGLFDGEICSGEDAFNPLEGELTMPPADGYFVAFRFVPVTNTTHLVPAGKSKGTAKLELPYAHIDLMNKLYIKLTNVKQDGVPLNVGKRCRTATPAAIRLKGKVNVTPGAESVIKSTYTIPKFSGCGVREDLDPLLTGLVSGPGNQLTTRLTSCGVGQECQPD
jgi:hypothetical protein